MASEVWVVVGGGSKGGVVVREGLATDSNLKADRLGTFSLVAQKALEGDRLQYELVSGTGPSSGWVSTKISQADGSTKDLLVSAAIVWKVVGGVDKGGILVRESKDKESLAATDRLATGAWIRELEVDGERLHFQKLSGSGPDTGWVSTRLQDGKDLVVRVSVAAAGDVWSRLPRGQPVIGRKVRVLAFHTSPGNSNMLKFQTTQLRRALGKDIEFVYIDAPTEWKPREAIDDPSGKGALYSAERSDFEKRLAGNKPFLEWLTFDFGDMRTPSPESVDKHRSHIQEFIKREAPIDVALGISQGSCVLGGFMEFLRARGEEVPWRLSILFSPVPPEHHLVADPPEDMWDHPLIAVLGGTTDPWYVEGKAGLLRRYSNLTQFEHEDGHTFPLTEPQASMIYNKLASAIRHVCGLPS